jgi:hypothetical protein
MLGSAVVRLGALLGLLAAPATAGYSHYFTWHSAPSDGALRECMKEMRLLVEARRTTLAGPDADGPPEVHLDSLAFNGAGEEDSHEPFFFPGEINRNPPIKGIPNGWNSCKTAGKPYDDVVTACLIVARDHFPESVLAIDSDGYWIDGDWAGGAALYTVVLHRAAHNPLGGEAVPGEQVNPVKSERSSVPSGRLTMIILGLAAVLFLLETGVGVRRSGATPGVRSVAKAPTRSPVRGGRSLRFGRT